MFHPLIPRAIMPKTHTTACLPLLVLSILWFQDPETPGKKKPFKAQVAGPYPQIVIFRTSEVAPTHILW